MHAIITKNLPAVALIVAGLLASVPEARATQASLGAWDEGHMSKARLISLDDSDARTIDIARTRAHPVGDPVIAPAVALAGVEIELAPGYKTYWRHPGSDGGIPPEFDWSASDNVAAVRVGYPAPAVFDGQMGQTIGYQDGVILPLVVTPIDASRSSTLRLAMFYGVCKDICIPAEARLEVPLGAVGEPEGAGLLLASPGRGSGLAAASSGPAAIAAVRLVEAIHALPQPMSELGPGDHPRVVATRSSPATAPDTDGEGRTLTIDVAVSDGETATLLVERDQPHGPVVNEAKAAPSPGIWRFDVALAADAGSGNASAQNGITVTILTPSRSVVASIPGP